MSMPDQVGPRPLLQARAPREVHLRITRRALDETRGNESELIRRLVEYALPRMPRGWWTDDTEAVPTPRPAPTP
jgi:hypothetical protein